MLTTKREIQPTGESTQKKAPKLSANQSATTTTTTATTTTTTTATTTTAAAATTTTSVRAFPL